VAVHGRREAAAAAAAAARAEAAAAGDERAVRQHRQRAAWAAAVALALPLARLRERVLAARAAVQVRASKGTADQRQTRDCGEGQRLGFTHVKDWAAWAAAITLTRRCRAVC